MVSFCHWWQWFCVHQCCTTSATHLLLEPCRHQSGRQLQCWMRGAGALRMIQLFGTLSTKHNLHDA